MKTFITFYNLRDKLLLQRVIIFDLKNLKYTLLSTQ